MMALVFIRRGWLTHLLLAFLIFSGGLTFGENAPQNTAQGVVPPVVVATSPGVSLPGSELPGKDKVVVYYLHPSFRCVTCKTTEDMTRALLESQFKEPMAQGRIEWQVADFQKEADLGKRFKAEINCVVVVHVTDGKEADYQMLDQISALMDDAAAFEKYVGDAIRKYLPQ